MPPPQPTSTLFPYTTLFRSNANCCAKAPPHETPNTSTTGASSTSSRWPVSRATCHMRYGSLVVDDSPVPGTSKRMTPRSEEHTSELQSLTNLVCRLLLEKKK